MSSFLTANTISELICLFFAIVCLATDKVRIWRLMIVYLFITCVAEIGGILVSHHSRYNHWVYNIFILFESGFTHAMFFYLLSKYINPRYLIFSGLALFAIMYCVELAIHGFFRYNHITFLIMSVQFVIYSVYYYYLSLKDERYTSYRTSAEFWWVAGVLLFYFTSTACNVFDDALYSVMINGKHHLAYFIFKALNIILYGFCWSYSFICRKWLVTKLETSSS